MSSHFLKATLSHLLSNNIIKQHLQQAVLTQAEFIGYKECASTQRQEHKDLDTPESVNKPFLDHQTLVHGLFLLLFALVCKDQNHSQVI